MAEDQAHLTFIFPFLVKSQDESRKYHNFKMYSYSCPATSVEAPHHNHKYLDLATRHGDQITQSFLCRSTVSRCSCIGNSKTGLGLGSPQISARQL